jgi:3-(3-hydroxy-phenyl)propionate hydroxylase
VHQRVAKTFRKGRAILAGDSAHVNSPIGGMGLNSGVHDAFNLAEKLLRSCARNGEDEVLDLTSAAAPRRPPAHAGADHSQQAPPGREGSGRAPEEPRRAAPDGGRPQAGAGLLLRSSLIESLREAERIT